MDAKELQNALTSTMGYGSARVVMSIVGPVLRAKDVQISQLQTLTAAELARQDERIIETIRNIGDEQARREMAETRAGELEDRVASLDRAAYAEKLRADGAEARLAELENATTWFTTCTNCARILDSSIKDYERAERATDENTELKMKLESTMATANAAMNAEIRARRRAEDTVNRVRDLRNRLLARDEIKWDRVARKITAALKPPEIEFAGPGGNAEDCPRCSDRQDLVYPFICQCPDELDDEGRVV